MHEDDVVAITQIEDHHWWYRERRSIIARELKTFAQPGDAIEIGAAGGGNSLTVKQCGWNVLATEYSDAGVRIARQRGLNAVHADARKLPVENESMDLAVAFDVLEHIEEDNVAAAELFRVLRPGGTALIAVPCDMELWSVHDEHQFHHRRYSKDELHALMTGAGFEIEKLWSWNVLLRPVVKMRRSKASLDDTKGDVDAVPPLVNVGLGMIVKLERYLPVRNLPGVSLMMRARKPQAAPIPA
ncbi:MAG: methyltransferase domain-containing protein [Hamadaea sp.]|nr:methyltransferase domain-containing protein [Hamadaea sp.]